MPATEVSFWALKFSDTLIIAATVAGPILAVQAQKWLERGRAIEDRRVAIFRALMTTRAARLAAAHVEAINAVPVEFYGRKPKLKAIVDDWHTYLDLLADKSLSTEAAVIERQRAFLDMLYKMSTYLGYSFSRSELEKDVYYPEGHAAIEADAETIRRGFAALLRGDISLPMRVTDFPYDNSVTTEQDALRHALTAFLQSQTK
ncbi:DUF6680 family protein [Sphingomonas phyllosphaerae]|uniref:DUF6680 family protein n=1 Tax=Sphingomonas phyllosphaerae TaxID=257003 RepID=UPI00048F327D|nr:DUF6680 family protein [Sphingomonas phyllosphaerae]